MHRQEWAVLRTEMKQSRECKNLGSEMLTTSGFHTVERRLKKALSKNGPLYIFSGKQREVSLVADQVRHVNFPRNLF